MVQKPKNRNYETKQNILYRQIRNFKPEPSQNQKFPPKDQIKRERNEKNVMRLARAYHKLRQWEKLQTLVSSALAVVDEAEDSPYKSKSCNNQLKVWQTEATEKLSNASNLKYMNFNIKQAGCIDDILFEHPTCCNLNEGKISLLEKAVAFGAAIDYPVKKSTGQLKGKEAAYGATPLLMAHATLVIDSKAPPYGEGIPLILSQTLENTNKSLLECAMQFVKLGSNCDAVCTYDNNDTVGFCGTMMQMLGIKNMSACQLAKISNHQEL